MIEALLALTALAGSDSLPLSGRATQAHSHTHAPTEIDESHGPYLLETTYTSEIISNASGGARRGTRYLDNLDIVFEADLDAAMGWQGAQLHVYGLYNNGKSISDLAGDSHAVSNIEAGTRAAKLYEAWIDQKFGEVASLKIGLYDLNSEFDALDASGLFIGSAHGIGTDISQSGQNGPSIFPNTSLAARLAVKPADGWVIRAAILDGVPGDPARPKRTAIKLGDGDGALLIGEVEAPFAGGKLLFGHWRYTADFDSNAGGRGDGNVGYYVRGEAPLVERDGRTVAGFFRLGTARGRYNMFDRFASGGLKFTGFIAGRAEDEIGVAVAAGFTSDSYRAANGTGDNEVVGELTYRTQLAPWLAVQPHAQYIINPSADPTVRNALVLGLRSEISFRWMQ